MIELTWIALILAGIRRPFQTLILFLLVFEETIGPGGFRNESIISIYQFTNEVYKFQVFDIRFIFIFMGIIFTTQIPTILKNIKIDAVTVVLVILFLLTTIISISQIGLQLQAFGITLWWLVLLAAYMTGKSELPQKVFTKNFLVILAVIFFLKSIIGLFALINGNYLYDSRISNLTIVYYDPVFSLISLSFAIFALAKSTSTRYAVVILVLVSFIQLISFRRSAVGLFLFGLVWILLSNFANNLRKGRVVTLAVVFSIALLVTSQGTVFLSRIASSWNSIMGVENEFSTKSRISESTTSIEIIRNNFWNGLGVRTTPQPGFVVTQGPDFYVHNEIFLVWIRFGFVTTFLYSALFVLNYRVLKIATRTKEADQMLLISVFLALTLPLLGIFFGMTNFSYRWGILWFLVLGYLSQQKSNKKILK